MGENEHERGGPENVHEIPASVSQDAPEDPVCHSSDPGGENAFLPYKEGVGKGTNFLPVKADALLATEPEPMEWVWERFLAVGSLILLTSFMKVGKSTFVYALVLAIVRGLSFLGYPTKAGPVLILAVEEHRRDVRARLERFGMKAGDQIYVHLGRLDHVYKTIDDLRRFITRYGIKIVILDTLTRYWYIRDENDNAEVVRRCSPFLDLARETGCAVILIHHDRKSGGEDGRAIRGGGALLGLVDQALMLDRGPGGDRDQRILRTIGRYEDTPDELVIALNGTEYISLGTPEERSKEATKAKVCQALGGQPQTVETLVFSTGLNPKAVREALDGLEQAIVREGAGKKGDPYKYRHKDDNSFLPHTSP